MGKISKFTKNINVTGRRYSPSHGHETGSQPSIDRPMIYRAYRMPRLEIRPSGTTPGGIFHLHERGAGWSRTGPAHVPFPKSSIGGPAPIFWPNFLGKNFGNKNRALASPERVLRVVPF